jgi:hypothetical protein
LLANIEKKITKKREENAEENRRYFKAMAQQELTTTKKEEEETNKVFAARLEELVEIGYKSLSAAGKEEMVVEKFINGHKGEIKNALRFSDPPTIKRAVEKAEKTAFNIKQRCSTKKREETKETETPAPLISEIATQQEKQRKEAEETKKALENLRIHTVQQIRPTYTEWVRNNQTSQNICRNCKTAGHPMHTCPQGRERVKRSCSDRGWPEPERFREKCQNCWEMGHTTNRCTRPVNWGRNNNQQPQQPQYQQQPQQPQYLQQPQYQQQTQYLQQPQYQQQQYIIQPQYEPQPPELEKLRQDIRNHCEQQTNQQRTNRIAEIETEQLNITNTRIVEDLQQMPYVGFSGTFEQQSKEVAGYPGQSYANIAIRNEMLRRNPPTEEQWKVLLAVREKWDRQREIDNKVEKHTGTHDERMREMVGYEGQSEEKKRITRGMLAWRPPTGEMWERMTTIRMTNDLKDANKKYETMIAMEEQLTEEHITNSKQKQREKIKELKDNLEKRLRINQGN